MNKKIKYIFIFFLALFILCSSNAAAAQYSKDFFLEISDQQKHIPQFEIPEYDTINLRNGMKIIALENNDLPLIELKAYINGGVINEAEYNAGVSKLIAEIMLKESQNYNHKDMKNYKAENALSIDLTTTKDRFELSADALSIYKEELISLIAEVLIRPNFSGDSFYTAVEESKRNYQQALKSDHNIRDMYFYKNIFAGHPYAYDDDNYLKLNFLKKADSSQLEEFHQNNFIPQNTVLVIHGDFNLAELEKIFKDEFSDWNNQISKTNYPLAKANQSIFNKTILINSPDSNTALVKMGQKFYSGYFSKWVPFSLANMAYAGGSNSQLNKIIKNNDYSINNINSFVLFRKSGGSYEISFSSNPEDLVKNMDFIKEELNLLKTGERRLDKDIINETSINISNSFINYYKDKFNLLVDEVYNSIIWSENHGFVNREFKMLNYSRKDELHEIYTQNIYPETFFNVIVGPKEKIIPQFEEAGIELEIIEINY